MPRDGRLWNQDNALVIQNASCHPTLRPNRPAGKSSKKRSDQFLVPTTSMICRANALSTDFENATVPNFSSLPSEVRMN